MQKPLLTIAIPTYNRAEYLDRTLKSIVSQKRFQNTYDVEIIISDNCSSDNTKNVSKKYVEEFKGKVLYFCNLENVKDKNMEMSLARGNGIFLKLNNDTLQHKINALDTMLDSIQNNMSSKNVLFFLNKSLNNTPSSLCADLNEFVSKVSYYSTWIGSFGIWKEDFDSLKDYDRYAELQLTQVDVLHRTISDKRKVYVNNDLIFVTQELGTKGGYDVIKVFLDNYTYILRQSLNRSYINKITYKKEIINLLINFLCPLLTKMAVFPKKYTFRAESKFKKIFYFYRFYPFALLLFLIKYISLIVYRNFRGR